MYVPKTLHIRGNSILLNFAETPFILPHPIPRPEELNLTGHPPGYAYTSAEHRFHAMKAFYIMEDYDYRDVHDYIASAPTARAAKNRGREIQIFSDLWDLGSFHVMLEAHFGKFTQNIPAKKALLLTGEQLLVERRPDPIWGDNMDGTGKNLCGKSLTITRDYIHSLPK
jgi:ribA/ribD-fused uncharacterized protein